MRLLVIVAAGAWLVGCSSAPSSATKEKAPDKVEYFKVDPATAGVISGKVRFAGGRPAAARIDIGEDEECVKLNRGGLYDEPVAVNRDGSLRNVFVYVKQGLEGKRFQPPAAPVVLDQKGCQFSPRVLGVRTGQTFQVTNSDPVTHNVHPIARMNREWNQSQAPGDPPLERRFVRPEVMIRVKCNVHNWMRSWMAAMDHPYFAITGPDGSFTIPDLPPGDYAVEAWQEALGTQEQRVHVDASGKTTLTFTFKAKEDSSK